MEAQAPIYRCKGCRETIFKSYIHHDNSCTSYFIEPPEWLTVSEDNDFKINCPKCKAKIGEAIFSGKKCSCGKWVTPGIQILGGKIDAIRPLN